WAAARAMLRDATTALARLAQQHLELQVRRAAVQHLSGTLDDLPRVEKRLGEIGYEVPLSPEQGHKLLDALDSAVATDALDGGDRSRTATRLREADEVSAHAALSATRQLLLHAWDGAQTAGVTVEGMRPSGQVDLLVLSAAQTELRRAVDAALADLDEQGARE